MSDSVTDALLRTLAFHESWGYAPTEAELVATLESPREVPRDAFLSARQALCESGKIRTLRGRWGFASSIERIVRQIEERDALQPRKRRRAIRIARLLARFGGVRFIALANTTALGAARDFGDLDFFIVVRRGSIWTTRLLAALPVKLLGLQPRGDDVRDAVCFSYFISDEGLDLSSHLLAPDDPYFRYWFLSLLPLFDDGVSRELWEANAEIRRHHPLAQTWIPSHDLRVDVPTVRLPVFSPVESFARRVQFPRLPGPVRDLMNRDTRVIVNDRALKFHVTDARDAFRETHRTRCTELGISV